MDLSALQAVGNLASAAGGAVQGYGEAQDRALKRKQQEQEDAYRKQMLDLQLADKGLMHSPEGGLIFTPEKQAQQRTEQMLRGAQSAKDLAEGETKYGKKAQFNEQGLLSGIEDIPGFVSPEERLARRAGLMESQRLAAEERKNERDAEKQKLTSATELRKEYNTQKSVQDLSIMNSAYNKIKDVAKEPSAANDMSLVYNFMKLQDPNSSVREGEYATAEQARGVDSSVLAAYNKLTKGERLTPEQRNDFLRSATTNFNSAIKANELIQNRYSDLAKSQQIDPSQVVYSYEPIPIAPMAPKKPGLLERTASLFSGGKNVSAAPMDPAKADRAKQILSDPNAPEKAKKGALNYLQSVGQ